MANEEHLTILEQGVGAWNKWQEENLEVQPDLSGANLTRVDLTEANLSGADLTEGSLNGAQLSEANLSGTNLDQVHLYHTNLNNLDLSTIIGLDTAKHIGPSSIGVDTLYKSKGTIPDVFLRGCGVPDSLIEYLPSLLGAMQPIQFYSCFISYSSKDHDFA